MQCLAYGLRVSTASGNTSLTASLFQSARNEFMFGGSVCPPEVDRDTDQMFPKTRSGEPNGVQCCQYLHRFGNDFDVKNYDPYLMAATALYLSAKVTENHVKFKDIIITFYEEIHKKDHPFEKDYQLYSNMKAAIIECELILIRMLKFKVDENLPHRYLNMYLETLFRWMGDPIKAAKWRSPVWHCSTTICVSTDAVFTKNPNK